MLLVELQLIGQWCFPISVLLVQDFVVVLHTCIIIAQVLGATFRTCNLKIVHIRRLNIFDFNLALPGEHHSLESRMN
jgi:hypothetical protein